MKNRICRRAGLAAKTCACIFSVLVLTASAQDADEVVIQLPPGVVLPPGVTLPSGPARPSSGTNKTAEAKSPEERQLQELLRLKFVRTAPAILDALANQFDEPKPVTNEVERFKQRIIVGDWVEVGKFLGGLTNDHGKQVYRYLLKELSNTGRPSGPPESPQPVPPMMPPQGQGPAILAAPALVPGDVLALAEIAPHPLEEEDAKGLGQLLKRLLTRGDALEPLLQRLEAGVRGIGGSDAADRQRAAEMLVAADRIVEAGRFLRTVASAEEKNDFAALDLHARVLMSLGSKEKDSKAFATAWDVNQFILASTNSAASNREPALKRSFELMPLIARETGTNWLRRSFSESPRQGLVLLSALSQMIQRGLSDRSTDTRQMNLELQKQVVEVFLSVTDPAQPHWRAALNLLAQGWMTEAAYSKQRWQPARNFGPQYDPFGNMTYYEPYPQPNVDGNQFPPLGAEQAANTAPGERWLAQLDESLQSALRALVADLYLKAEQIDKALPFLEALASAEPRAASDLANECLKVWARTRNPMQQPRNMPYGPYGPFYYGPGSPYGMRGPGISLTRAMQARNIRELAGLLRRLEAVNLAKLNDDALVGAFSSAHSPAEVFRVEDMETAFGSLERIKLDTLAGLAQTMRERLAGQWRQPRVQQEARTQRNDKQIDAEVLRGYEVVLKLVDDGLKRDGNNWLLNLARAAAWFDLAEFQYGKKIDLAIYVEKREEAFRGFARAAALYAAALSGIEEKEQSPKVFQQWFNATLGASDLAYVTRQQEPETNHLQLIRSAILTLPGGAAERHTAAFAKQLGQSANTLRPELKPRYLRAGLSIVGDHKDAEEARKIVTYYDDLLREIEFVVRLDGDAVVGHAAPFGVFVSLRHTADVERETGGFARYLRNLKKASYAINYYNPYAQQTPRNFVEEFEKQVREKLTDKFDIKTITFLDEKVLSRGFGRAGWRETPLAYLLIQSRDGSVDQIPALHMDLDFVDTRGAVVLPVESQITLLDARPDHAAQRPLTNAEITQILDDREIAQGRLALEIKATARGLVPELNALLKTNFAGLRVEEFSDRGLGISQMDTEGDDVTPVSDRNWLIKLRVTEEAPRSLAFKFPEPSLAGAKMIYKRYADADLVEVNPEVALAGVTLRPRPWWHWLVLGVFALAAMGGGIGWLRQHKPQVARERPAYILPEPATAFAVISLLRRMEADPSLHWADSDRAELGKNIRWLEDCFFSREHNVNPAPNLVDVGRRWVALAGNGR
jgi:hypothetical protein